MKIIVEFNDKAKDRIKKTFISEIIKETLECSDEANLQNKNVILSVANVSEGEIKNINKSYRRKSKSTDVLSFAEYKNLEEIKKSKERDIFLGEIILCYNDIKKYSRKQKINFQKELAEVVSHGTLHLLGMKHGKKMFEIQKKSAGIKYSG